MSASPKVAVEVEKTGVTHEVPHLVLTTIQVTNTHRGHAQEDEKPSQRFVRAIRQFFISQGEIG